MLLYVCVTVNILNSVLLNSGLFMALQPKVIISGKTRAAISWDMLGAPAMLLGAPSMSPISLVTGFLVGPTMILATSKVMGIHGVHLHITIVQVKRNPLLESQQIARPFKAYTIVVCDTTV